MRLSTIFFLCLLSLLPYRAWSTHGEKQGPEARAKTESGKIPADSITEEEAKIDADENDEVSEEKTKTALKGSSENAFRCIQECGDKYRMLPEPGKSFHTRQCARSCY